MAKDILELTVEDASTGDHYEVVVTGDPHGMAVQVKGTCIVLDFAGGMVRMYEGDKEDGSCEYVDGIVIRQQSGQQPPAA